MESDGALSKPKKLQFLLDQLQARIAAREAAVAPLPLMEADWAEWARLMLGIQTMQNFLDLPEEETTLQTMLDAAEGGQRMPWLNMLANFKVKRGLFTEAEEIERQVLPWMGTRYMLGRDSPQALGTRRLLIEAVWM